MGKGISAVANIFKNSSLDRHAQKFEDYLIGDAKAILFLEETYQSLANSQNDQRKINPLITEILKLNQSQFSSHDIFEVSGIQKEEPPTAEKMVKAIDLLTEDLEKFAQELKQEKDQYAEKIKTFFSDEDNNTLQAELIELLKKLSEKESENGSTQSSTSTYSQSQSIRLNQGQAKQREDLQKQIISKKTSLEQLIISAKEKLKSTSKFSDTKRKEREKKLELLFKNLPATSEEFIKSLESIKTGLSGKLTKEEVNELCQKQVELMKLQIELENLQKQEQKPLQIQPPYGTPGSR